jgi:DNA invertase Pin-like site-specific DNA recombinase
VYRVEILNLLSGARRQLVPLCYKNGPFVSSGPVGRGFMAMMSAMAEDERLRIMKRTHEGRQIARAKGVRMGRKPKLTPHQIKEARQRLAKGEPTRDLAKSYGVSVSTISRLTTGSTRNEI